MDITSCKHCRKRIGNHGGVWVHLASRSVVCPAPGGCMYPAEPGERRTRQRRRNRS